MTTLLLVGSCGSGDTGTDPQPPTISFSLNPTSATVDQGGSVAVAGTATVGGTFTGPVAVTLEGWPMGLTGVVSGLQSDGTTTTVAVTLTVATTLAAGTYNLTIRAAGSGISAEATFVLTVNAVAEYVLEVSPDTLTIVPGTTGDSTEVTLTRTNFTGDVNLTAEDLPAGMVVSFSPNPVSSNTSTATVTVGGSVADGTYDVLIRGSATGLADRTDTLVVIVSAPPGSAYSLSVTPDTLSITQGEQGMAAVGISRINGHTDAVSLTLIGGPVSVTGLFIPNPVTGNTSDLTVDVGPSVPAGGYDVNVRGQDGVLADRLAPLHVIVIPAPAYTMSLTPDTLTVEQGSTGDVTVTLARTNFADTVHLTVEGLVLGVTASFTPVSTPGDASTLTVNVQLGSVAAGDYTLTVRGTSTLPDQTETFVLRVVEPIGFSLSMIPDLTAPQGGSGSTDVTILRTGGYTGSVTITVEGLIAGLTATVSPSSTVGTTATITISADAGVVVSTYFANVRGTGSEAPDATRSMDINVTGTPGILVSMDFTTCAVSERPVWLAFQDGAGAWTPVTSSPSDVYSFRIASATGGVSYVVLPSPGEQSVITQQLTQAEWVSGDFIQLCEPTATLKTVNGTVANSGVTTANLTLGGATTTTFGDGGFSISGVGSGELDFIGYAVASDSMLILRDQDILDGGNLPLIDFAANGFAADSALITIDGLLGGEVLFGGTDYGTVSAGNSCSVAPLKGGALSGSPFMAKGAPIAQQAADEFHVVWANALSATGSRTVRRTIRGGGLSDQGIFLGAPFPTPTVVSVSASTANYLRRQADFTLPAEYDGFSSFFYGVGGWTVVMFASNGAQASSVFFALPDFSGLTGWMDAWAPPTSSTGVTWGTTGFGQTAAQPSCASGALVVIAFQTGSYN